MAHRGPDDHGQYFTRLGAMHACLISTRLSILDLSQAGHMPMSNRDGTIWAVYNGEIYNHLEIREQTSRAGFSHYASRTDTETLIYAYQAFGLDCFQHFNGMFAVALVDHPGQRVVIARDRMGIKPLYYYWDGMQLVFASELKTLVLHPAIGRSVNQKALNIYLTFGFVPSPYCLIDGVKKLEPGHVLVLENGKLMQQSFWTPVVEANNHRPMPELISETRRLMENAVSRQLMGDVPLGVLLSGGLDSTIITALACRFHDSPIHTFSIGFKTENVELEAMYNADRAHAEIAARQLGTIHHELTFADSAAHLIPTLEEQLWSLDEPVWEASHLSINLMAGLARELGVKILLTGDGSDEYFGGYPWYRGAMRLAQYERIPWLNPMLHFLQAVTPNGAVLHQKAVDLRAKYRQPYHIKYLANHHQFSAAMRKQILSDGYYLPDDELVLYLRELMKPASSVPVADQYAFADQMLWVREHFNQRLDRMMMAESIEGRVPFQDNEIVDFALSLGMDQKIVKGVQKGLLREAFKDLLPANVLERPKRPFAAPAVAWLQGSLKQYALDTLSEPALSQLNLVNSRHIESFTREMIQSGFHGWNSERNAMLVWNLLVLCIWLRQWQ